MVAGPIGEGDAQRGALGVGFAVEEVEARLIGAIHLRFSLPARPSPAVLRMVKGADRAAAFFEATHLAGFAEEEAARFFGRPDLRLRELDQLMAPMPSDRAEDLFISRFRAIEAEMSDGPR